MIPVKTFNAYTPGTVGVTEDAMYADGDFVVNVCGCMEHARDCRTEMKPYLEKLYPPTG